MFNIWTKVIVLVLSHNNLEQALQKYYCNFNKETFEETVFLVSIMI